MLFSSLVPFVAGGLVLGILDPNDRDMLLHGETIIFLVISIADIVIQSFPLGRTTKGIQEKISMWLNNVWASVPVGEIGCAGMQVGVLVITFFFDSTQFDARIWPLLMFIFVSIIVIIVEKINRGLGKIKDPVGGYLDFAYWNKVW